jgi:hypothetical protein
LTAESHAGATAADAAGTADAAGADQSPPLDELLAELQQREERRQAEAEEQFEALARAVADGQSSSAERLSDILAASSKTADQFRQAVELQQKRAQWRATIARQAELGAQIRPITEKIRRERDRFDVLRREHEETVAALAKDAQRLGFSPDDAKHALKCLHDTAPPRLQDRLAKLEVQIGQLRLRQHTARREAARIREVSAAWKASRAKQMPQMGRPGTTESEELAARQREDAAAESRAAAEDAKAVELQPRIDALQTEIAELDGSLVDA